MKTLFILNGPTCGDEESYNALRLAGSLARREDNKDAPGCLAPGARLPET